MLTIGLTGGIASGKSTVARIFEQHGCAVIEADLLAHDFLKPESPAAQKVVAEFGGEILGVDGKIDRAKLGEIVFGHPEKLARLNALIHPLVRREVERRLAEFAHPGGPSVAVVVAALHLEAGYAKRFDRLVVAWCLPGQQIERLVGRGLTREQAVARIASQMPIEEKRRLADDVIDCSQSLEVTRRQTEALWKKYQQLS